MNRETFKNLLNFEVITKLFFDLSKERYPASDKILQLASRIVDPLSTDSFERIYVKISLLNAIRNMVKEVSPTRIYRSMQHRDDLLAAIIDALEILEDELEELEESEIDEETGI